MATSTALKPHGSRRIGCISRGPLLSLASASSWRVSRCETRFGTDGSLSSCIASIRRRSTHAIFRGWRYAFVPALNQGFGKQLFWRSVSAGRRQLSTRPKDDAHHQHSRHLGGLWRLHGFRHALSRPLPFAGSLSWGTAVVNGVGGHLLQVLLTQSYNPGAVQSVIMVPLGLYIIWGTKRPWLCLANGLAFHVLAFGIGINLVLRGHAPEAATTIAFNVLARCCSRSPSRGR